jgi:kinetochore protein Spc7/SPC105
MNHGCYRYNLANVTREIANVNKLEAKHGWLITSASDDNAFPSPSITMTYRSELQLFFHPLSFGDAGSESSHAPLSLTYIGDTATPHPSPLTTTKRFFLQLLRAHLQCLPRSSTSVSTLLGLVRSGWDVACAVAEGVRALEVEGITEESILGDERLSLQTTVLLPSVMSKVKIIFEIGVGISENTVNAAVGARAEVVYGEKYNEPRMGEFLMHKCGEQVADKADVKSWGEAVSELRERLIARGRRGQRLDYD